MLWRSPLRDDSTAVLAPGSCRITRYALARCAQTDAASMRTKRADRAPTLALRSSSPQKSPLPGAAWREVAAGFVRVAHHERCRKDEPGQAAMRL